MPEIDDGDKLDADLGVAVEFEGEDEDEDSDGDEVLVRNRSGCIVAAVQLLCCSCSTTCDADVHLLLTWVLETHAKAALQLSPAEANRMPPAVAAGVCCPPVHSLVKATCDCRCCGEMVDHGIQSGVAHRSLMKMT